MPAPAPSGPASTSDMLDAAYRRFKSGALKCLPMMMPAVLAVQAADIYWLLTGHSGGKILEPRDGTYYTLTFVGLLLFVWLMGAVVLRLQSMKAGQLRPAATDLSESAALWPGLFASSMLASLLVMLGLLALVAPGIWLSVCLTPLYPVVLIERLAPVAAIRRCIALVRPIWVKVLAAMVIGILIMLICLFTVGVILALLLAPIGTGPTPMANAVSTTASLLVAALAQLFFISLALEIYSSASASA
jgi:hypothetical protein